MYTFALFSGPIVDHIGESDMQRSLQRSISNRKLNIQNEDLFLNLVNVNVLMHGESNRLDTLNIDASKMHGSTKVRLKFCFCKVPGCTGLAETEWCPRRDCLTFPFKHKQETSLKR